VIVNQMAEQDQSGGKIVRALEAVVETSAAHAPESRDLETLVRAHLRAGQELDSALRSELGEKQRWRLLSALVEQFQDPLDKSGLVEDWVQDVKPGGL
jgi:hypothetical protein